MENKLKRLKKEWKELPELPLPVEYWIKCNYCEEKGYLVSEKNEFYRNNNYLISCDMIKCNACQGWGWYKKYDVIKLIHKGLR